ncbi:MAG: M24 family metallopeptidase [Gemmatimonadales bacterium]
MKALERIDPTVLEQALNTTGADGWLLYDFHGVNPVARRVIGYEGMVTRRVFVWLPAQGPPVAIVHSIDAAAVQDFAGKTVVYTTWQELHQKLETLVTGKRVAMEVSPGNTVPYVDRVPHGVVELLSGLGAQVLPSDQLVTNFAARWTNAELAAHRAAAEIVAEIARSTLEVAVCEAGQVNEIDIQRRVMEQFERAGLSVEDPPIVAFGAHAADPHHNTAQSGDRALLKDEVILLDLWARGEHAAWADQTWMGFSGHTPPKEVVDVWDAVTAARDAVVEHLDSACAAGQAITGASLDRAARDLLAKRGYAAEFGHRTGHSIDQDLHGSGPHLDDFETHDVRTLVPGVVFSVEPGVYLAGRFGVRSEINVIMGDSGPEVTPKVRQTQLFLPT